jgi:hypothetical protein
MQIMIGSIAMTRSFANPNPDRRAFMGGSDARIIMGEEVARCSFASSSFRSVQAIGS